jgi:DNA helicase-2/ATP-dependent DNA helicase PcrA
LTSDLAKSILEQLDPAQAEAASALRGPVCIIAGPGSGKTRTISARIALGVATGVFNPDRVLALSYTNRAAAELRSRLRQVGTSTVAVRTFHSAALSQLQYFWPQLTGGAAPKLLTQKRPILAEVASLIGLKLSDSQLLAVASEIEYLRYSLTELEDYLQSRRLPDFLSQEQFADVEKRYREQKLARRLMDWEDAILLCTGLLRNEARALSHFQQQYRFFSVDEYQDISPLQEGLLRTWLGDREDICAVGDPRQTIYSFAGASSGFLLDFQNRYPQAATFELNRNYRSASKIVDLANQVLPEKPLSKVRVDLGVTSVSQNSSQAEEASVIAREIVSALAEHRPSELAVLARTNSQLLQIEAELRGLGVRTQVRGQGRFFRQPNVMRAMSAIRALAVADSGDPLFMQVSQILVSLGWTARHREDEEWASLNWFTQVLDELGLVGSSEYIRELEERERSGHEPTVEAVTLATVHATKGLEWNQVYLVGINRGLFPISHAQEAAAVEEEKRLFYVAVTRARDKLAISHFGEPSEFIELFGSRS